MPMSAMGRKQTFELWRGLGGFPPVGFNQRVGESLPNPLVHLCVKSIALNFSSPLAVRADL